MKNLYISHSGLDPESRNYFTILDSRLRTLKGIYDGNDNLELFLLSSVWSQCPHGGACLPQFGVPYFF